MTSGFLQIPPHGGHPCLRLTLPTAERVAVFHHPVVAHAGHTKKRIAMYFCNAFFCFGQHRTIPALRLKHRSDGCGTASALPKCLIMSGCGTRRASAHQGVTGTMTVYKTAIRCLWRSLLPRPHRCAQSQPSNNVCAGWFRFARLLPAGPDRQSRNHKSLRSSRHFSHNQPRGGLLGAAGVLDLP